MKRANKPRTSTRIAVFADEDFSWRRGGNPHAFSATATIAMLPPLADPRWRTGEPTQVLAWAVGADSSRLHRGPETVMALRDPEGTSRWAPLSEPALFRRFVELDGSVESFVRFADRYGVLGIGVPYAERKTDNSMYVVAPHQLSGVERLEHWATVHAAMKRATTLWEMLRADYVSPADRHEVIAALGQMSHDLNDPDAGPQLSRDLRESIAWFVRMEISAYLSGFIEAIEVKELISGVPMPHPLRAATPLLVLDVGSTAEGGVLKVRPQSLLCVLWLQFAQAVQEERQFARCANCQEWFLKTRANRELCSNACKTMIHRKREQGGTNATT